MQSPQNMLLLQNPFNISFGYTKHYVFWNSDTFKVCYQKVCENENLRGNFVTNMGFVWIKSTLLSHKILIKHVFYSSEKLAIWLAGLVRSNDHHAQLSTMLGWVTCEARYLGKCGAWTKGESVSVCSYSWEELEYDTWEEQRLTDLCVAYACSRWRGLVCAWMHYAVSDMTSSV